MKKLILILAIATFISCSTEDAPVNNCYRIDSKEVLDGNWYVNGKVVTESFWRARTVGEIYCPSATPSY
jgi:hypothetical protein